MAKEATYDASSITVLEGLEAYEEGPGCTLAVYLPRDSII